MATPAMWFPLNPRTGSTDKTTLNQSAGHCKRLERLAKQAAAAQAGDKISGNGSNQVKFKRQRSDSTVLKQQVKDGACGNVSTLRRSVEIQSEDIAVTIKDLCEADRQRIAELIREIAKITSEKRNLESAYDTERTSRQGEIEQTRARLSELERDRHALQHQVVEYQRLLCESQKQIYAHFSNEQALAKRIDELMAELQLQSRSRKEIEKHSRPVDQTNGGGDAGKVYDSHFEHARDADAEARRRRSKSASKSRSHSRHESSRSLKRSKDRSRRHDSQSPNRRELQSQAVANSASRSPKRRLNASTNTSFTSDHTLQMKRIDTAKLDDQRHAGFANSFPSAIAFGSAITSSPRAPQSARAAPAYAIQPTVSSSSSAFALRDVHALRRVPPRTISSSNPAVTTKKHVKVTESEVDKFSDFDVELLDSLISDGDVNNDSLSDCLAPISAGRWDDRVPLSVNANREDEILSDLFFVE